MIAEIQDYLRVCVNNLHLFSAANVGALPAGGGISIQWGAGAPTSEHFDRGGRYELYFSVNAKQTNQLIALSALESIHKFLTHMKFYPSGTDYQILNISTGTVPNYLGTDSSNQHMFGSIVRVTFYAKGID